MSPITHRDEHGSPGVEIATDVLVLRTLIANVCFLGSPGPGGWVLVDAGLAVSGGQILEAAAGRFGPDSRPTAIILTHGHFDHVGALARLNERWDVPIYAHEAELPYLTGEKDYPPPDTTAEGGLISRLSPLFPRRAIDLGERVRPLPAGGAVPGAPGWRWLHTPGHTPGHVSLFREADRVLIAGDAFTTVEQESALAVLLQEQEVHGPPGYFTMDWAEARRSVERLNALRPAVVGTGHGAPMGGPELASQLGELIREWAHHQR